jgi:hypothetical protein
VNGTSLSAVQCPKAAAAVARAKSAGRGRLDLSSDEWHVIREELIANTSWVSVHAADVAECRDAQLPGQVGSLDGLRVFVID